MLLRSHTRETRRAREPGIKTGQSGDRANLVDTRGSSVDRCCWETWTQSICQPSAMDLRKESQGKKVCREVLRGKDGGIGEMLPFKGKRKQRSLVKNTQRRKREEAEKLGCQERREWPTESDDSGRTKK